MKLRILPKIKVTEKRVETSCIKDNQGLNVQRVLEGNNRDNGKQAIFNEKFQNLGSTVSSEQDT